MIAFPIVGLRPRIARFVTLSGPFVAVVFRRTQSAEGRLFRRLWQEALATKSAQDFRPASLGQQVPLYHGASWRIMRSLGSVESGHPGPATKLLNVGIWNAQTLDSSNMH
jgi:hypothetical protein